MRGKGNTFFLLRHILIKDYIVGMKILTPLIVSSLLITPLWAQEPSKSPAESIQDNSFLVEEAYNQERGIVQHIFNLQGSWDRVSGSDERDWVFTFTQEWPVFSQTHQFSYTVPYLWLNGGGQKINGVGDVLLNYRYQALMESDRVPAFAPRFSLILPTGDESKGLGNNRLGYQFNLPVSKIVSDRVTLHGNAGLTYLPDIQGRNPVSYNLGASVIYAVTPRFNLMLESIAGWTEEVANRRIDRSFQAIVSPGIRYAFNLDAGQLVLGVAAPIGVSRDAPDYGAFFYLSWEHGFLKNPK
jgi:hypothetical protein